jgi:hypothetical protein
LKVEIHAFGPVQADEPGSIATSAYCPLEPGSEAGPRKSIEFFVTKVQSPSRMTVFRLQSFQPPFPGHTTCEDSPCPRLCASFANSGLRHSSIRSFILLSGDGLDDGQ